MSMPKLVRFQWRPMGAAGSAGDAPEQAASTQKIDALQQPRLVLKQWVEVELVTAMPVGKEPGRATVPPAGPSEPAAVQTAAAVAAAKTPVPIVLSATLSMAFVPGARVVLPRAERVKLAAGCALALPGEPAQAALGQHGRGVELHVEGPEAAQP